MQADVINELDAEDAEAILAEMDMPRDAADVRRLAWLCMTTNLRVV